MMKHQHPWIRKISYHHVNWQQPWNSIGKQGQHHHHSDFSEVDVQTYSRQGSGQDTAARTCVNGRRHGVHNNVDSRFSVIRRWWRCHWYTRNIVIINTVGVREGTLTGPITKGHTWIRWTNRSVTSCIPKSVVIVTVVYVIHNKTNETARELYRCWWVAAATV